MLWRKEKYSLFCLINIGYITTIYLIYLCSMWIWVKKHIRIAQQPNYRLWTREAKYVLPITGAFPLPNRSYYEPIHALLLPRLIFPFFWALLLINSVSFHFTLYVFCVHVYNVVCVFEVTSNRLETPKNNIRSIFSRQSQLFSRVVFFFFLESCVCARIEILIRLGIIST